MKSLEKVLITGANGFTGPYLAKALKKRGFSLIGSSLETVASCSSDFDQIVNIDLTNIDQTRTVISDISPDYVVHLAGMSFVGHSDLNAFYNINVVGTEHLLTAIAEADCNIKNILLASSANVYGAPPDTKVITELNIPAPVNHYAISKLAMEFAAKKHMNILPITLARPFNYIGFGQSESFVIPKIVKAYAHKDTQLELGSTNVSRDFSSVYDTVDAYVELLTQPKCVGEVFNVCSGTETSLSDVLQFMNEISGYGIKIISNPKFMRKHEISKLCGSYAKINKYTDWRPTRNLKDTIAEMFNRYRDHV